MDEPKLIANSFFKALLDANNLPILLKSLALMFSLIGIYFNDLVQIFSNALYSEAASHVLILPILIAYLVYRKRKIISATIRKDEIIVHYNRLYVVITGFLLCLIASMLYFYGSQTFTPLQYHMLTVPIFISGLILVLFNPQTLRELIVPVIFTVFFVPPPTYILNNLGFVLSVGSTQIANAFANLFGVGSWITVQSGTPAINLIGPENQPLSFTVDLACSGIYSLMAFLVFSVFVAYIVRDKTWKKIMIFVFGFPIFYILNTLRISVIILIAKFSGPTLALEIFHLLGGWILICAGTIILLVVAEKILKLEFFSKKANSTKSDSDLLWVKKQYKTLIGKQFEETKKRLKILDFGKIVSLITITVIVISLQMPLFSPTIGPAQILVQNNGYQEGNIALFPTISNYSLRFSYRDTDFEELSGQDYSLAYDLSPENPGDPEISLLLEVDDTFGPLHPWEDCLVEWRIIIGEEPVSVLDLKDTTLMENPLILGRYFAFNRSNRIQLVLYWFEKAVFNINEDFTPKYVKISLVSFFDNPDDLLNNEEKLLPIGQSIVNYWRNSNTWNSALMFLSNYSIYLALILFCLLVAVLVVYFIQARNNNKKCNLTYQKLSKPNQLVVDSIKETQKSMIPTLDNILTVYNKKTNQSIQKEQLIQKIASLEKMELIKYQIINNQDEADHTWITPI